MLVTTRHRFFTAFYAISNSLHSTLAITFANWPLAICTSIPGAFIKIITLKPTNQYIAEHALRLFNKSGVVNVRLQHIADAAFVSVGHLAYHFKNKEALVEYLFEQHKQESEQLLQAYRIMPLFADVDRMFCALYLLQEKYSFLYKDLLELVRAYPLMAGRFAAYSSWQQMQLTLMVDFQLARGALFLPNRYVSAVDIAILLQRHLALWHIQAGLQLTSSLSS